MITTVLFTVVEQFLSTKVLQLCVVLFYFSTLHNLCGAGLFQLCSLLDFPFSGNHGRDGGGN